jgi:hypothetical protein
VLISLISVAISYSSNAQITKKPKLDFKVKFNDLNKQLEVVWASCLENSVVKLLDNNLKPIKTQVLCKDMQGIIDISDLQSDLYYVQIEHYTGVGIQPIVTVSKKGKELINSKPLKEDLIFSIYPNPSQDEITIESNDFAPNTIVTILDLQGRQIKSSTLNSSKSIIDISSLAQGVYFIRMEDDSRIGVQELVKK